MMPNPAIRSATKLLKALSNPHRLLILCQLLGSEKRVGELEQLTGLSQSAMSQHLARLRRDKLVKTRRESQTIFYSAANNDVDQVIRVLHTLFCAPQSANSSKPSPTGRTAARRR
jgi:ArsR family transcriptional regulator, virulence genes transcriptional regulator